MSDFFKKIVVFILRFEAQLVLKRHRPKIIAVVGTVGKTGAKDALFEALSEKFFVRKSEKSFNSEIGVPLTILGLGNAWKNPFLWCKNLIWGGLVALLPTKYPEWVILEMGIQKPGDMESLATWIHPDVVVMTRFANIPVHVEFFSSPEAVLEEKAKIVDSLRKEGILLLNFDDKKIMSLKEKFSGKTLTYGFNEGADFHISDFAVEYKSNDLGRKIPCGVAFVVSSQNEKVSCRVTDSLGKSSAYGIAGAVALGLEKGISVKQIESALQNHVPPAGRMRILPGIKQTFIIDDSYNSSPVAAQSALETLRDLECSGKRIAVLGDMLELGKYAAAEHKKIGMYAGAFCDVLLTVGIRARYFAEGAFRSGMPEKNIYQFDSAKEAGKFLERIMEEGDIILVKGSQGTGKDAIRMEKTVEEIMEHPEDKDSLLVRQDNEWQKR